MTCLDLLFSLDVEKMFTNIKRDGGEKEFKSLIGEEIIRGWKKKEILETLRYIWNNTYWIIEGKVVKVYEPNTSRNSNENMGRGESRRGK